MDRRMMMKAAIMAPFLSVLARNGREMPEMYINGRKITGTGEKLPVSEEIPLGMTWTGPDGRKYMYVQCRKFIPIGKAVTYTDTWEEINI